MLVILAQHLRNVPDLHKPVKGSRKATVRQEDDMDNQAEAIIQT